VAAHTYEDGPTCRNPMIASRKAHILLIPEEPRKETIYLLITIFVNVGQELKN
jgi:hypothetical protein